MPRNRIFFEIAKMMSKLTSDHPGTALNDVLADRQESGVIIFEQYI